MTDESMQRRWWPMLFRLMAIAMGAIHAWAAASSHSMNADGINYLDMGDATMRGDWQMAFNPVWSPMYAWLLGGVMRLVNPPMQWEFPMVHAVNFGIYLIALVCFEYFWRRVMEYHHARTKDSNGQRYVSLPGWAWLGLGYAIFIFSSLFLIEIWSVTPDMLMAAFVYLAAALVLQIRMGDTRWRNFILLGIVLGLSYLVKAVMFPVSILFLIAALFAVGNIRQAVPRIMVILFAFILISLPYLAVISIFEGKPTFGDAATLTYARYVNGLPYPHWQGEPPGFGIPEHPTRQIFNAPPIYEFGTPVGGTYPVSYDPSYWYDGLVRRLDLRKQVGYLVVSGAWFTDLFVRQQGALVVGVVLLYLLSYQKPLGLQKDFTSRWGLAFVALAVFGFYASVNVTGRYVGVFVVLLWADLLANVRVRESQPNRRLVSLLSVVMILVMLVNIVAFNLEGYSDLTVGDSGRSPTVAETGPPAAPEPGPPSWPGEVAEELHRLDVVPEDKVGIIGFGFDSFWARLARVQIVAEMLGQDAHAYWFGDPALRADVIQAFDSTGAKAIVAEFVPIYADPAGWHQVGNSNYYIYLLADQK